MCFQRWAFIEGGGDGGVSQTHTTSFSSQEDVQIRTLFDVTHQSVGWGATGTSPDVSLVFPLLAERTQPGARR